MRILAKNVLKSVTRSSLYIPRRHEMFKSASATENNDGLLLRRFRWSLNENKIFSHVSLENFTSSTKLCSLISSGFSSPEEIPYFCGNSTKFFSALSPDTLSPLKPPHCFPHLNDYSVLGSWGGVVCLDNVHEGAVFWNPSTNELKFLPPSDLNRPNPAEAHPLTIDTFTFTSGFGFDSKTQDYKYIRWVSFFYADEDYRLHDQETIFELYSLKADSWKPIYHFARGCLSSRGTSACVCGDFYWTVDGIDTAKIQRFDFSTEEFSYIPFPAIRKGKRVGGAHIHRMYNFAGKVGVVVFEREGVDKTFELLSWDAGRRWWRRELDDHIAGADRPLGFSKDGRFMFMQGTDRCLLAYDVHAKKLVKKFDDVYCSRYGMDVIHYQETAFPLNA